MDDGFHHAIEPLAFAICTDGPIRKLWVHYTTLVQGSRFYDANLLRICPTSILRTVRTFFMSVEGWMEWARSEILDDIAEQLFLVRKAARRQICSTSYFRNLHCRVVCPTML